VTGGRRQGERPAIVLAMLEGLAGHAFTPEHLDRLRAVGDLLDDAPLEDFSTERARELLGRARILVGHWGCPTLTAEVLSAAPHLELFAYAAGTVKWQVTDVGKRVGLVGASHVGRLVIERLAPYDLSLAVYDPYLSAADAAALGVELVADLDELCAGVDVLSLHAPDVEATKGMIGARQLSLLRDGATFINTARPALVDTRALEAELRSGRIAAILDVTDPEPLPVDHELLRLPNVFVTPHVAGAAGTELTRLADLAVEEVERHVAGLPPRYPVTAADLDRIA
jgi:phosphoglycerate dehydrogenase-like enzyme